jgi:hypothetical protein
MTNYLVHNTSRARDNRTLRAKQPTHRGHKQYVPGTSTRVLRARETIVSEDVLKANLDAFMQREREGLIKVTTTDRRPVDLKTFKVGTLAPASPPVNKRLDSAANDKPGGHVIPRYAGDGPIPNEFEMPVDAPPAAFDMPVEASPPVPPPVDLEPEVDVVAEEEPPVPVPPPAAQVDPAPRLAGPLGGDGHQVTIPPAQERPSQQHNKKKGGR